MDPKITRYFADIIDFARSTFDDLDVQTDNTPQRSILKIQAEYQGYRVLITELISADYRKYRYYVLKEDYVIAGFDNAPDPRALRLKYGEISEDVRDKLVPHLHLKDKTELELTEEIAFEMFLEWLKTHLNTTLST